MNALLEYQSVEVCFNGIPVVRNVSFSVHPGEIFGIVGESGSGKTPLLKAALGLLGPGGQVTRGNILFEGKNLPDLSAKDLRRISGAGIGMIFQDTEASFCPVRTIGSQIYESMRAHEKISKKEARARTLDLFEALRLSDGPRIWDSYPFQLSGGMNQRVGIAAAMLPRPQILLADEPTSALDTAAQRQAADELLRLRELYGTAVILVSHDIGLMSYLADSLLVLKDGTAAECGTAEQVLQAPQKAYTRELLAAVPKLRSTMDGTDP